MKKTFLMLLLFLATIGVSFAEDVWVRSYLIKDKKHPFEKGVMLSKGYEIKSYGPVDRSEVRESPERVNILFTSQEAYEAGVSKEEIDSAIANKILEEQTKQ